MESGAFFKVCQEWKDYAERAGLPDGFVSDQKYQFGYILEDLGMENVVIKYILVILNILRSLGLFNGQLLVLYSF
jgi:hypothetical protein